MSEDKKEEVVVSEVKSTSDGKALSSTGLTANLAGALSYIWIVGLIFLFTEKKSTFVRFHAIQGLLISLLSILSWIDIFWFFGGIINLIVFILLVIGAVKAYQGEKYKFPVAGDIAEQQSKNLPQ